MIASLFRAFRYRIVWKLLAIFSVLMMAGLLLLSVLSAAVITSVLETEKTEYNRLVLARVNDFVNAKLRSARQVLVDTLQTQTTTDRTVSDFLLAVEGADDQGRSIRDYEGFRRHFLAMLGVDEDLTAISVLRKSDGALHRFPRTSAGGTAASPGQQAAMLGQLGILNADFVASPREAGPGADELLLMVNLKDVVTYQNLAVLELSFSQTRLGRLIAEFYQGAIATDISLVSRDHTVLFNNQGRGVGLPYEGRLTDSAQGDQLVQVLSDNPLGITVVGVTAASEIRRTADTINRFVLIIALVFIVLAPLIAYLSSRSFARRIVSIRVALDKIAAGDLTVRLPRSRATDEVSDVALTLNAMCADLEKHIEREYRSELRIKQVELQSLQSQIDPHFLYNTLDEIRMKARAAGADDAEKMIMTLARLLRFSMGRELLITLGEEVERTESYLAIMSLKDARWEVTLEIDPAVRQLGILRNVLQPVVENSFQHGFVEGRRNTLAIRASAVGNELVLVVEDNGCGLSAPRLAEVRERLSSPNPLATESIGLSNVAERLRLIFGEGFRLEIESAPGAGTRVTIYLKALSWEELRYHVYGSDR